MPYIQVLVNKLPTNCYQDIIKYYNERRPEGSQPIYKAAVCEGGFEIPLDKEEIDNLKTHKGQPYLDPNDTVRQVRWNSGWLLNMSYMNLREEETSLLYQALKHVMGDDQVVCQNYVNNKTWWNKRNT